MVNSVYNTELQSLQSLAIRISIEADDSMSRRSGHGRTSRGDGSDSTRNVIGSSQLDSSNTYPFTMLDPANADTSVRRHSMTVQDMLNPIDEDPRSSSRSESCLSGGDEEDDHSSEPHIRGNSSYRANRSRRHGSYTRRTSSIHFSNRGSHRANRHASRQSSLSSSSGSDISNPREFRRPYSPEEADFIW